MSINRSRRGNPYAKPSPQLYACKLQELEDEHAQDLIDLYCGYEFHVCTGGYVPYGWQFRGEDCHVPSNRKFRLNCLGIIDRNSNYDGFTTTESINSEKIIEYLDERSLRVSKKTDAVSLEMHCISDDIDCISKEMCIISLETDDISLETGCVSEET